LVRKATNFWAYAFKNNLEFEALARESFKYGLLIIGTTVVSGLMMFLMRQAIIVMSRHIEYDMKNEIFAHYQRLDVAFYRRNSTGDLMNRISEDVSRVRMYIGPAIMYFVGTISTLILVAATMTAVNLKLTLYVLIPLPFLVVIIYFVSNLINKASTQVQEQLSKLSTIAQETFSGIRVLKAYVQEESMSKYFSDESVIYRKKYLKLIFTEAMFGPFVMLLMGLSTIATIYIGGRQAIAGEISYGNIAEFTIYIAKLTWPVASLGWVTSLVQRAAASQTRINEFLNTKPTITPSIPAGKRTQNKQLFGDIVFRNVSLVYPDSGIKALDDVSFEVQRGTSLAIVGKTGSGKSSVAALLCRLYDITSGEILIDGKNIRDWDLPFIRRQIGYVPQDTFLFSDTIENNISFGLHSANVIPALISQAAKNSGIENDILLFPDKYKTLIGERGITLSGGQKQRIAIARAIIGSPKILILDDCLSAIDTETESQILHNLLKVMKGKTTILISHRVSTVQYASHIIVLDKGKIVEEGTHAELMTRKGLYYQLYQMQLVEEGN
jgi:ATP-binding cassette subfamily B protein